MLGDEREHVRQGQQLRHGVAEQGRQPRVGVDHPLVLHDVDAHDRPLDERIEVRQGRAPGGSERAARIVQIHSVLVWRLIGGRRAVAQGPSGSARGVRTRHNRRR